MKKIKTTAIIIMLIMIICLCASCGKSNITGKWSVSSGNTSYEVSIDESGNIVKDSEIIGHVSEDSKSITLSEINKTDNNPKQDEQSKPADLDFGLIIQPGNSNNSRYSAAAEISDKYSFEELAYYFGVSKNIKSTESPINETEFKDSLMYNALLGNYIPQFKLDSATEKYFFDTDCGAKWLKDITLALPELMGTYSNATMYNSFKGSNPCIFCVQPAIEALTQQQIYNRQIEALSTALEINKTLRDAGKIKDDMTDMKKAQAFAEYLKSLNMDPSNGGYCPPEENMYYDTAFSGLVQKVAACGGRAASYNLLLRTEGIACTAIGCTVNENGGGHYINRMILDGKEYFYDWYNEPWFPKIMTKAEAEKVVTFYDGQYEYTGTLIDSWNK